MSGPTEAVAKQGWSKDLADCVPKLITAYPVVAAKFMEAHPDLWMRCDYTWRSKQFQFDLFKKGRTLIDGVWKVTGAKVTDKDGINSPSHHNVYPSRALDFIIFRGKTPLWSTKADPVAQALYIEVGRLFESQGIVSGATWKSDWKDPGHVQDSLEPVV